jgi:6-phosphogluconolactonase
MSAIALALGCNSSGTTSPAEPGPAGLDASFDASSGTGGSSVQPDAQPGVVDASADVPVQAKPSLVYVGAGDGNLYQYAMDGASAKLTQKSLVATGSYPSFFAMSPDKTHGYACNESDGTVASMSVNAATGALTLVGTTTAGGAATFVSTDRTGSWVFAANYNGGTVMVFPTTRGAAGAASQTVTTGKWPHMIATDPSNKFALVPCKGADRIEQYKLDAMTGTLTPNAPPSIASAAGAGPRHLAFHPNGKWVYVINELGSTMASYTFDAVAGTLTVLDTPVSTLPSGTAATGQTAAEVVVAPSGKFLYGSNRGSAATGSNSIVIYSVDQTTGKIALIGHQDTTGKTPRSFALDPTGTFLFAANQDSNNVVAFRIDGAKGTLTKLDTTSVPDLAYWVGVFSLP